MSNIEAKSIVKGFNRIRRAQKEREYALLHERAYRGVPTSGSRWMKKDVHGNFTYRGVAYTK